MANRGRIIKGIGGFYSVLLDGGETVVCKARGRFRNEGILNPKVKDVEPKTLLYQVPGGMLSNLISQISCHYHFLCSKFFLRAVKLLPCSCLVRHLNTCKRSGAGYLKRAGGYNFTVLDT